MTIWEVVNEVGEGRLPLLLVPVGSNNYNLHTKESDDDYKVYVLPTFNDLYTGNRLKKEMTSTSMDMVAFDIRLLEEQLFKSNINFVEGLFSKDMAYGPELDNTFREMMEELVGMREQVARMNLPHLYEGCRGMASNQLKMMSKVRRNTAHLIEKHGDYTKEEAFKMVKEFMKKSVEIEEDYKSRPVDMKTGEKINRILVELLQHAYRPNVQ